MLKIKRRHDLLITATIGLWAVVPLTCGQCPQICDFNENTALGTGALEQVSGDSNTAVGHDAMGKSTERSGNTAVRKFAVLNYLKSDDNTAVGYGTMGSAVDSFSIGSTRCCSMNFWKSIAQSKNKPLSLRNRIEKIAILEATVAQQQKDIAAQETENEHSHFRPAKNECSA